MNKIEVTEKKIGPKISPEEFQVRAKENIVETKSQNSRNQGSCLPKATCFTGGACKLAEKGTADLQLPSPASSWLFIWFIYHLLSFLNF